MVPSANELNSALANVLTSAETLPEANVSPLWQHHTTTQVPRVCTLCKPIELTHTAAKTHIDCSHAKMFASLISVMSMFQVWYFSTPFTLSPSDFRDQNVSTCVYASWHNDNLSVPGSAFSWLIILFPVKIKGIPETYHNNSQFL